MKEYFIRFRPISYIFRKDWYCKNRVTLSDIAVLSDIYKKYHWITDIGFISIGRRKT